ncbi:MAG: alpha/beta hydrolase [Sphingomonas fennica]
MPPLSPAARPDVAAFLTYLNALEGPKSRDIGAVAARAQMVANVPLLDQPVGPLATVADLAAPAPGGGTIPLRLFDARAERGAGPVVVFFHGGGWVVGDLDTHAPFCAEMARVLDLPVVAVDYRLAPEHRWPAAPDDCEAAARWIAGSPAALGRTVTGLVTVGDSAGGNLAVVTAMALRDQPAAVPVLVQAPVYPSVDRAESYGSYADYGDGYLLSRDGMDWFKEVYAPDLDHWRGAPLHADQAGMPPTLVVTAGLDPLRDQGRAYAARTIAAGVPTVYREAAGTIHGFVQLRRAVPSAEGDVAGLLAALKAMIAEAVA